MYRKFKADKIFTGYEILEGNHVLVTDHSGSIQEIVDIPDAGDDIESHRGIISPGFINCHCHLELSHMKGLIPKHTGLVDFVLKIVNERHFAEEEIYKAIVKAEQEMLQNGIVAVGDICNNLLTLKQKSQNNLYYQNFIEVSGFPPAIATSRFQRALDLYKGYQSISASNSIVPHAPYSVSPELFSLINQFSANDIISIHNQEIFAENEFFLNGRGDLVRMYDKMGIDISFFKATKKSSLQTWFPYFTNGKSLILVHNIAISTEDIEFTKHFRRSPDSFGQTSNLKPETFFCLCPNANLYISNLLPDVKMLLQHECPIVFGTDSLASNDQLNILEEIRTILKIYPDMPLTDPLKWATINGARALGIENRFGSFEKAKKPGVVLIGQNEVGELIKAKKIA